MGSTSAKKLLDEFTKKYQQLIPMKDVKYLI